MKKTTLLAAITLSISSMVAQPNPPKQKNNQMMHPHKMMQNPEERAKHQANAMEKHLMLSPEQKQKVYEASLRKNTKIKAAIENHKNDPDPKQGVGPEIKLARKTFETELNTILTLEQQQKWKAHKEEMKKKHDAKKAEMQSKKQTGIKEPDDNEENDLE